MSGIRDLVDRARARTRRETTGREDGWGVMVDPEDTDELREANAQPAQDMEPGGPGPVTSGAATVPAVTGQDVGSTGQAPVVAVRPVTVPRGVDIAAAWSWRVIVIAIAGYGLYLLVGYFSAVVIPVAIAVLITALAIPVVDLMERIGVPRALAAAITVVIGLGLVSALLALVGTQVSAQFDQLRESVRLGLDDVQDWLRDGPLQLSQGQVEQGIVQLQTAIAPGDENGGVVEQVATVGSTVGHVFTGFFIALFTVIFLLYDGARVWAWIVRLFPRDARDAVDSSGKVAWVSLTAFVRATVLVALVDALGIGLTAYFLDVPLALAIGVLVFLGAFVPVVGAFVSGGAACLVALVDQGPYVALAMFAAVLVVQQLESHILQPFLMGRFVQLHPLAVILAIAAGVVVAGIIGALVAVPIAAVANAVATNLAARQSESHRARGGAVRVRRV
uniref:FIG01121868: Possible membrane protein, Rv0205 n=1 Tax=uncultured Nocardioidaceae bacterium TaxID=253824 RepID=A0A6J4KQW4_9ACTN|nr:MAG: FIG01121868: Possible membrane protein, Rv0205 [uncultured Nocardioidaceae bacterium]